MASATTERRLAARKLYESLTMRALANGLLTFSHRAEAISVWAERAKKAGFGDDLYDHLRSLPDTKEPLYLYKVQFNHSHQSWVADGINDQFAMFKQVSELRRAGFSSEELISDWDNALELVQWVAKHDTDPWSPLIYRAWEQIKDEFKLCFEFLKMFPDGKRDR